jgi:hypothetical protein
VRGASVFAIGASRVSARDSGSKRIGDGEQGMPMSDFTID